MTAIQLVERRSRRDRSAARFANRIVPDSTLDDPKHWQERAEEARSIAEELKDPESKRMLLRIADDYDRLAAHARARMKARAAQS